MCYVCCIICVSNMYLDESCLKPENMQIVEFAISFEMQYGNFGVIHNPHVVNFLCLFDPLPPSWSLLLNKAYFIIWTFG